MRAILSLFLALLYLWPTQIFAQPMPGARLSLQQGKPVQSGDVTSGTLYFGGWNAPSLALNLAGLAANSTNDVFQVGQTMCSAPAPITATGYQLLTGGALIGGMTGNGGLAAAFDGNPSKGYLASAKSYPGAISNYVHDGSIGKSFATPVIVTALKARSPTDNGFIGNNLGGAWELIGADTDDLSAGTVLATGKYVGGVADYINYQFQNATPYKVYLLVFWGNGINGAYAAQVELYQDTPNPPRGTTVSLAGEPMSDHDVPNCNAGGGVTIDCPLGGCYHLGAAKISSIAGQVRCTKSYGLDRECGVWNAKNQKEICLIAGDPAPASLAIPSSCHPGNPCYGYPLIQYYDPLQNYPVGPANGNPLHRLRILSGQPDQQIKVTYEQGYFMDAASYQYPALWWGVGVNSTSQITGGSPSRTIDNSPGPQISGSGVGVAFAQPFLGEKAFNALEGGRMPGVFMSRGEVNNRLMACYKN